MAAFADTAFDAGAFANTAFDFGTVAAEVFSGGFWNGYADVAQKRKDRLKKLLELEEQVQQITDDTDKEIAELIHEQDKKEAEKAELARIQNFARQYNDARAKELFGEKVALALAKASVQGTFSAAQNLLKEVQRAQEEEEFAIRATMLIIELT